jgi:hypothetical protein
MRLTFEKLDARHGCAEVDVYDEETGKCVGKVGASNGVFHEGYPYRARYVRLFNQKYFGTFDTHDECVAFVKGVETVLNHMIEAGSDPNG